MNGESAHKDEIPERTMREARAPGGRISSGTGTDDPRAEGRSLPVPPCSARASARRGGRPARSRVQTPVGLRERLQAQGPVPTPLVRRPRLAFGGALAAAAVAAVLLALVAPASGAGGPTVVQAAQLSRLPATASVQVAPSNPKLLAAPSTASGSRTGPRNSDGGRRNPVRSARRPRRRTVFYEHGGKRLAYTIVSGDGIPPPRLPRRRRATASTFARPAGAPDRHLVARGRTCVLSSAGVGDAQLLKLASWKGDGAVPF